MIRYTTIRLYPSPAQKRAINAQLDCHRELYNSVLTDAQSSYEKGVFISDFDLIKKWVNHFRKTDLRFKDTNYSSMQHTVRRFGKTRRAAIKKRSAKQKCSMRLKPYHRFNSLEYTYGDGIKIVKDRVRMKGIGEIKAFWHKEVTNPKYAIITRRGDSYYANFSNEFPNGIAPKNGESIGIDFGIKTFLTLSNGEKIDSPKFLKRDLKAIRKAHAKISKTEKSTPERKSRVKILSKISRRITDRRKDFNHQISRRLVDRFTTICIEDINTTDLMGDTKAVNRTINDLGFGQFKNFLTYKAESAGKKVVLVNPAYTTQACSDCGDIKPKTLDERQHKCSCGYEDCRDINAAKNILASGLRCLAQA